MDSVPRLLILSEFQAGVVCLVCHVEPQLWRAGKLSHGFQKRRVNFKAIETNMTDLSIAWGYLEGTKQLLTKNLFNKFEQKFYLISDDT